MGKVELQTEEYNDLILALNKALNDKLELKREGVKLYDKYIDLLAKHLDKNALVWTYSFKEDVEITEDNIKDYVSYSTWESDEFDKQELLEAVRYLWYGKFNKR
jgi:hemerythrin-like domain-containing protein